MNKRNEYDHAINMYHHRFISEGLKDLEVSRVESRYLVKISFAEGKCLLNDIVEESVYHKSQATRAINKLVEEGYVIKQKNPDDKRGYFVSLTDKGKKVAERVKKVLDGWEDLVNQVITDDDRKYLENLTLRIYKLLKNYYGEEDEVNESHI
jgi:DNA-binding MarR family transcriptional regulator